MKADLSLEQRYLGVRLKYAFFEKHVEHSIRDRNREQTAFSAKYQDLPTIFEYGIFRPKIFTRRILIAGGVAFGLLLLNLSQALSFASASFLLIVIAARLFVFISRKDYTTLPLKNGKILVLKNHAHDRIIGELQQRRALALQAAVPVDFLNPSLEGIHKSRWLWDNGAHTLEEYENNCRLLGFPEAAGPAMDASSLAKLTLKQSALLYRAKFVFHSTHLEYFRDEGAARSLNVRYTDLFGPQAFKRFVRMGPLGYLTIRKITAVPTPKGDLYVLQGGQHDRILKTMQRRRKAAFRKLAFIDRYSSPDVRLRRLTWLRDEDLISQADFEALQPTASACSEEDLNTHSSAKTAKPLLQ